LTLDKLLTQSATAFFLMKAHLPEALLFVAIFWGVHIINFLLGYRLNIFGIYPRHWRGLLGIPCFSFLHTGFDHLFFNSIPLIVLIDFVLLRGMHTLIFVSVTIIVLSGITIWLFGRHAIHIGASCLVMGYWSYLLINAYQHPSVLTIILAIICVYYFGGLLLGLFPTKERVSWEGHVFGFLAGVMAFYICPY
jgi:membrane associated rhomboid family serine protease